MVVKENKLPLVEYMASAYPDINLGGTMLIGCQHLLGSTADMFYFLFEKGLKPENTYLLGKAYSTNNEVVHAIKERGVHVKETTYDSHQSFDSQHRQGILSLLSHIKKTRNLPEFERIVILDDGGKLHSLVQEELDDFSNIFGVEQTSSGIETIKYINLQYPIINVARSRAKLNIESPFIAEAVIDRLRTYLKKNSEILILGNGAIGNSIYETLKKDYSLARYDTVKGKSDLANLSELEKYDLVIGCTGKTSIFQDMFKYLKKGVILASASSSDVEFSGTHLRRLVPRNEDPHKEVIVNNIRLLNSGFPINFDGSLHSVPPEKIQFTRALLFSAICEAEKIKNKKGIVELSQKVQDKLISEYILSSNG